MVYVPTYNSSNCVYVRDSNTIRVYDSHPTQGATVGYTDYYVNSHYLYTNGSTTFNNYSTLPTCLVSTEISTNPWYRNDIADICIVFFIILTISYFIIKKIIRALFWGGRFA